MNYFYQTLGVTAWIIAVSLFSNMLIVRENTKQLESVKAFVQEKDIQKIERLNNIFKAENSSKMNQFGQSLGEVAKGLSKLANADSEKLARNLDMIKSNLNAISKINLSNLVKKLLFFSL